MKNSNIVQLNKILTNTLEYKEVLQDLANSNSDGTTKDKLREFAKVADVESKNLTLLISDLGGDVNSTGRHTDQEAVGWIKRPLPDPQNTEAVLECLIKAERQKKEDYSRLLKQEDMKEVDLLNKYRKEAEGNLKYFQSALSSLDNK